MSDSEPKALAPPTSGALTVIDDALIERAVEHARVNRRQRVILPFHRAPEAALHRMLNAMQPGSYVRPHRHLDPPKAEAWIVLRGSVAFFTFEDDGRVRDCLRVGGPDAPLGVDLEPGVYHGLVALEPDTVLYEVKPGPYAVTTDKSFAPWSPEEGAPEAAKYLEGLRGEYRKRTGHHVVEPRRPPR